MDNVPSYEKKQEKKKAIDPALDAVEKMMKQDDALSESVLTQLPAIGATYQLTIVSFASDDSHHIREPLSPYDLGRSGIFSLAPGGFEAHEGDIILTSRDQEKEIHVLEEAVANWNNLQKCESFPPQRGR